MSVQMPLFAEPVERLTVEPTAEVLLRGADAEEVPTHEHVPTRRPATLVNDEEWLRVLRIAEKLIRWRRWDIPHPLPLDAKPDVNGFGSDHLHDSKGVALYDLKAGWSSERRYASWANLLRGLSEQREREPHIADARDLAAAYSSYETFDRYYIRDGGEVQHLVGRPDSLRDDWRERVAIPHLEELGQIIERLGGEVIA